MGDLNLDGVNSLLLRQKRERIVGEMKAAVQEQMKPETSEARKAELNLAFDRAEKDEADVSALIEKIERTEKLSRETVETQLEGLDKRGAAPKGDKQVQYRNAFNNWFRSQTLSGEEQALLTEHRGTNTQIAGTGSLGGYLVPQGFWPDITKAMLSYSGIAEAARMWTTSSGNLTYKPTLDDTTTSALLVAESGAFTVQDLTYGQKQFDAYKYGTLLKVSLEALQDAEFNFESEIRDSMMPRFGRALNASCTTGTGSSQPNGVVTASTLGATAASTTAITRSEIVDLLHSVDPSYRNGPKVGFMMNDAVLKAVKKLAVGTADATPLWQRSMTVGEPSTIEGYRYWINQGMTAAMTTGLKVMLFGDFDNYVIRMVKALEVARLNELYAVNGQVGFLGFMRWDGECVNTSAIKYLALA